MKIAVVTDDEQTISQHFGRAKFYLVVEVVDGQVTGRTVRKKPGHKNHDHHTHHEHDHDHETGTHTGERHQQMAAVIQDCDIVLARGMGAGAKNNLKKVGLQLYQVNLSQIDEAVQAVIGGEIESHISEQSCGDHHHT